MKSPAFSFYVRDWLCSKTVSKLHSKPCSKGVSAYIYLLCSAWLEDPPATLPNDDNALAGYARLSRQEWDELKPDLMCQFIVNSEGRLVNQRLMEEWLKQQYRKSAGSKGGSKKATNLLAKRVANPVAALEDANANGNGTSDLGGVGDAAIPIWAEVKTYASMHAIPESSAKNFFDYHQDNNLWLNRNGSLINWTSKVLTWATRDREKQTTKPRLGPKLADVIAFVKEKCPLDDRAANWSASFFGTWHRRGWMRKGVPIDWKVELSKQVATWGKEA